jgi:LacI family transcriptional regulator
MSIRSETRKRIQKAAEEMGYQHNSFASSLRKKKSNTIGVVLPRLNSYFMSTVVAGMEKTVNKNGYNLIISQSQESVEKERTNISTMFNSRVEGLLVSLAYDTENLQHFDAFLNKEIPVIFFDRVFYHPDCTSIVIDNFKAGYDATLHLIQQGCKKIFHLGGSLKRNVYQDRFNGYKQALKDNGIAFQESMVHLSMLDEHSGIDLAKKILKMKQPPDGIFTSNDTSAVALMCELKKGGIKIPEQIAVVGFNNNPISRIIEPNLSTIDYPGLEMGKLAAITLIDELNNSNKNKQKSIVLGHELLVRQSSLRNNW